MLITACVYLTLRTLKQEQSSWKLQALLGLCLGAALLTKLTAVLLLPLVFIALSWQTLRLKDRPKTGWSHWLMRITLVFGICALVSGWHYARGWQHAQAWLRENSQLLAAWDPRTGFPWWQDEGYRTRSFYLHFGDALFHPWYSSMRSFVDGIYSTFWGDSLFSGATELRYRPPWNYDLMLAGYWLALLPTLFIIAGVVIAVIRFVRQPSPEWFLLLGLGFVMASALLFFSLVVPYYCTVKAIYGLSFLVPVCACAAIAWQMLFQKVGASGNACQSPSRFKKFTWPGAALVISILFCVWAVDSYAFFWIRHSSVPTLLGRVRHLVEERQYTEAVGMLRSRLDLGTGSAMDDPSDKAACAEIRCFLASLLLASGNYVEAQQQSEAVLQDNPNNGDAHLALEQALARQGHAEEAMAHAQRAIELIPGSSLPYNDLAELLLKKSRYDETTRVAREGLAIAPSNPQLHLLLGCGLLSTEKDAAALSQLGLALNLRPDWPEGHVLLGSILQMRGRYDVAAEAYAQALRSNPDDADCQAALGAVLLMQGKPGEAAAHLSEAVRLQPGNSRARCQLAGALQADHKTTEAINQYLEALRLDPSFPDALNDLAWIRAAHAKPEFRNGAEAVRLGEEACRLTDYKEPIFIGTLAAAYAEAGRFQEAATMATKAKDLAQAAGKTDLARKNAELLELYKAGKPYYEPAE
jgi:tetratricopeptide (TPR) repeat protein